MSGSHDARPLLPHQQALIDRFFSEPKIRGCLVRADPGLGASFAMAHLIKRFLKMQPVARILVLSPAVVLQMQVQRVLREIGVGAEAVDRFRYRELQDALPDDEAIWRKGGVFVLGVDFAKRDDITHSLCSVPWTLVVVPEAHQIAGKRETFIRKLVTSSPELQLLLLTLRSVNNVPTLGIEPWTEIVWRSEDVVDLQGRRLFSETPTRVELIEFQRSVAEQKVLGLLAEIARLLQLPGGGGGLLSSVLYRSMLSSPATLEEVIRRFRNRLAHGAAEVVSSSDEMDDETDADNLPSATSADPAQLLDALNACLSALESLQEDSKLVALKDLISEALAIGELPRAMCILTEYRATLLYLQTALEELGLDPYILHGEMPVDERARAVDEFRKNGGVLIATSALASEGISLAGVDWAVLYDLPRSLINMEQIYGRFARVGRITPLTVTVLLDREMPADGALNKLRSLAAGENRGG